MLQSKLWLQQLLPRMTLPLQAVVVMTAVAPQVAVAVAQVVALLHLHHHRLAVVAQVAVVRAAQVQVHPLQAVVVQVIRNLTVTGEGSAVAVTAAATTVGLERSNINTLFFIKPTEIVLSSMTFPQLMWLVCF